MRHKYGNFTEKQIRLTKKSIRKQIFFLLLCADPKTKSKYIHIDVIEAFKGLLYKLDGLSNILGNPQEIVEIVGMLEEALIQYTEPNFDFQVYKRLVLGAGSLVNNIKEVD